MDIPKTKRRRQSRLARYERSVVKRVGAFLAGIILTFLILLIVEIASGLREMSKIENEIEVSWQIPSEPVDIKMTVAQPTTDADFDEDVLQSSIPVLVVFLADWDGPSMHLKPTIRRVAEQYAGRIRVVTVNVDDNPLTVSRLEIKAIPTMVLHAGGATKTRIIGTASYRDIVDKIDPASAGDVDPRTDDVKMIKGIVCVVTLILLSCCIFVGVVYLLSWQWMLMGTVIASPLLLLWWFTV